MNPLPSIELIGFLNWIDSNRIDFLPANQTLEEFFLNENNREDAEHLASRYLWEVDSGGRWYSYSWKKQFVVSLDLLLADIKQDCLLRYSYLHCPTYDLEDFIDLFKSSVETCLSSNIFYFHDNYLPPHPPKTPETIIRSIWTYLMRSGDSAIKNYLSCLDGSSAKTVKEFLRYLSSRVSLNNKNDNIPSAIIKRYIQQYVHDIYFIKKLSESQMDDLQKILERAFFENNNSSYFTSITSVQKTTHRYLNRETRYKCVFLADGPTFYDLVEKNWETLHAYSGNYLDIFYNPDELLIKGYKTADKLAIRGLVKQYPSIFLWHTSLSRGTAIPVNGLKWEELFDLLKLIIDTIALDLSFDEVKNKSLLYANQLKNNSLLSSKIKQFLLNSLFIACSQLQANPSVYGDANENQRNTQIRDLLGNLLRTPISTESQSFQFVISDQTLQGLSSSGKSAGEIDLLVKLNHDPYTIIEALNLQSTRNGVHWNRTYLKEHISRLGKYDQNGLQRNIVLVYATSDNFECFYTSLLNSVNSSKTHYNIGDNRIFGAEDISHHFSSVANLRVANAKYKYNGRECELYFFVVRIESLTINDT